MATSRTSYTPEQSFRVCNLYKQFPEDKTIKALAMEMGKTEKSIVAKLVREGLYKAQPYVTKKGEKPVAKSVHAEKLAALVGLTEPTDIKALARVNKGALAKIIAILQPENKLPLGKQ